jgi:hypothetical protein
MIDPRLHMKAFNRISVGTPANPPKESLLGGFPSRWTTPALLFYEGKRGF